MELRKSFVSLFYISGLITCLTVTVQATTPTMVYIPSGTFQMGNSFHPEGDWDEVPVHTVTLSSFWMSKYEITNGQYCGFLNSAYPAQIKEDGGIIYASSDSGNSYPYCFLSQIDFSGGVFTVRSKGGRSMINDPVVQVSWYGAKAFCDYYGYRLPTEAQWEYAARGGYSGRRFPWGNTITHSQANYDSSSSQSYDISPTRGYHPTWNDGIYPYTSPVGSFAANGYGLHDMTGNVWEWCSDWIGSYLSIPQTNPTGPTTGSDRVRRGGDWRHVSYWARVANRGRRSPDFTVNILGFRVCLDSAPLPDLIVNSLTIDTNPIVQPGSATISCTVKNQGNADATPPNYWLRVRLSLDNVYDESDTYVAGRQIPVNLPPGAQRTEEINFNSDSYNTGAFFLVAKIDEPDIVTELFENNNTKSLPFTIEPNNGHTVQGYVKYSTGTPFGNVTVRLTGEGENLTDYTQGDGYYHFDGLADGNYTVAAEKTGWVFTNSPQEAIVTGDNVWLDDMLGSLLPPEETITKPGTPTGEINPVEDVSYTYTTSGATSSLGHTPIEYQFDWDASGAHDFSTWSTSTSAGHSWSSTGERQITVTARCQTHTDKTNISDPLTVTVIPDEPPPPTKKRLIIDTDPAMGDSDPDDNTALIYALQSPDLCTVEGITYGYGNFGGQLPDSDGTRGANRMLDYYQLQLNKIIEVLQEAGAIDTVPSIYRGHKKSETWDNNPNPPSNSAVEFIRNTVRGNPGQISVIALGTLTNIATAIASYPDGSGSDPNGFMRDCKELWIIGGGIDIGNVFDPYTLSFFSAEFNIWRDRIATEYVLLHAIKDANGVPKIKMVPLNATWRMLIDSQNISQFENNANPRLSNYLSFPMRWWIDEVHPLDCRQLDPNENGALAVARGYNYAGGQTHAVWLPGLIALGINFFSLDLIGLSNVVDYMFSIEPAGAPAFPPYDTIGMALALEPNDPILAIQTDDYKVFVHIPTGETIRYDDLDDRDEVRVFETYDDTEMTNRIISRWTETEHHNPPQNKKFIECSDADYVIQYNLDQYASLRNVSDDIDGYYHLPIGVALYVPVLPELPDLAAKYRGRLIFDLNLARNTSVTEVKLHIYCDKKTDWADTQHRVSLYRCDPDETDPAVIWASASPANAYYSDTHIGTLQAWRTVNLGGSAVSDFQQAVATCENSFSIVLAEDGDDDSCVWFDTSKDWKAYLEVEFDTSCPNADLDGDCKVNGEDFGTMAGQWQQTGPCLSADIAPEPKDNTVNLLDLALFLQYWLAGTQ